MVEGRRTLRDLSRNAPFWGAYREGLPVYGVGACLMGYLIEAHGLSVVKDICRASYDEDDDLAGVIERHTGVALETIEARVAAWLPQSVEDGRHRGGRATAR